MKHAKGYAIYAREDGLPRHRPDQYKVEWINGMPCCGLCSYPVVGAEVKNGTLKKAEKNHEQFTRKN